MPQVYKNEHWILERDTGRPLVIVRRTAQPYLAVADVEASFRLLEKAIDEGDRRSSVLILDMRAGPFRNDPEFERAADTHPARFARGFLRLAILVRTAAGRLQAMRYFRERGIEVAALNDEIEAASLLLAPPSSRRKP